MLTTVLLSCVTYMYLHVLSYVAYCSSIGKRIEYHVHFLFLM